MENRGKLHVVIVILLIVFTAILSAIAVKYDAIERYETLEDEYYDLLFDYKYLENQYDDTMANCNNLVDQYTDLDEKYAVLLETSSLSIDHLMEMTYSEIRETIQPQYSGWWGQYYYNQNSVEYASYVAAHDLGRRYWPSIEDKYEEITGTHLSHKAYNRLVKLTGVIGISDMDSDAEKVEKILEYTSTQIIYQSDQNNEFLFPMETITFKSGDCDDFTILAAALFEQVGIESAIGSFKNENIGHCMALVNLDDLGSHGYWSYDDLTTHGLATGKWIILEPQVPIDRQHDGDIIQKWEMTAVAEVPNE